MLKRLSGAIVIGVVLIGVIACWLAYTWFFQYQSEVDRLVATMPPVQVSPAARSVFAALDGEARVWIVTRYLLFHVAPERVAMLKWQFRGALWGALLPLRLSDAQLLSVYSHAINAPAVSKRLFGKSLAELSTDEAIAVVAAGRIGLRADPNSQRFKDLTARLTERYRGRS